MKSPLYGPVISVLVSLVFGLASLQASADAELRLYSGNFEWDLKDRIVIHGQDGASFDFQFKKVCTAYTGCRAVQLNSDQDAQLAKVAAGDLSELNAAITKISDGGNAVAATPARPSLCRQFTRFLYEVKNSSGKTIKTEEVRACAGSRLPDANALTIERVLNIAAEFAGL